MKLGRLIRAITGHNNLLYHLHNIDPNISPICRFCLEQNEEFHHLASDCPPLWWERHNISAQESNSPATWSLQQITDFTYIPKINEAFVRPLYVMDSSRNQTSHEVSLSQHANDPDSIQPINSYSDVESDMDISDSVSSLDDSSSEGSQTSLISVDSD